MLGVNLLDLDGFSFCRKLREDRNDVPLIFLIPHEDPADLRAGFTGGRDGPLKTG